MEREYQLHEITEAAGWLRDITAGATIIAFRGELGAGKTTLIQAFCHLLGVKDRVGSPTFSIINEYLSESAGQIFHIDLYRCRSEEEAVRAGVEDCLYSGSLCLVEWPSKAPGIFPPTTPLITITAIDERTRKLVFTAASAKELRA